MIRRILIPMLIACASCSLRAQATPFVPPSERVYRDIERLAAAGLIDSMVVGARPFTEREVVRLLVEARTNLTRLRGSPDWATQTIDAQLARYQRTGNKPVDLVAIEGAYMDSPYRVVEPDPNGQLNAAVNPLGSYRSGRVLADGATGAVESRHTATVGSYVAVALAPRAWVVDDRGDATRTNLRLQTASVNFLFDNVSILIGRDNLIFSQAPMGGLLLSENGPSLDMLRVGNDRPFALPWIFRVLGLLRADVFVSDLGTAQQLHPHARLAGYHVALLPYRNVEIGVQVIDAMGGRGGQPASFGDRVLDAIPIVDAFRTNSDFEFSNKMAGGDFHVRVPSWSGFELYGEADVDDLDVRRLHSSLFEDGGYIFGTAWSCIMECGRLGVRAEYRQTGIRYYTHGDYPIERNGILIGDPLGPRGLGGYLTVDLDRTMPGQISLVGAFEVRSGNSYASNTTGAHQEGFHFVQVAHRPGEKRARFQAAWMPSSRALRLTPRFTVGAERVSNYAFVSGANRTNWLARVELVIRP